MSRPSRSGVMGRKVLTPLQQRVLATLFDHGLDTRGYYLTGGTALAEFYLQHRYSDDLDFFTRKSGPLARDFRELQATLSSSGLAISIQSSSGEYLRMLVQSQHSQDGDLKVEFARDVPARMAPPLHQGRIIVDSYQDIAVNKVCAILSRQPPEPKDFVDLYFILKESRYTLEYLLGRAKEKAADFDTEEGVLAFATALRGVEDLTFLPRMIKPLTLEQLRSILAPLAVDIINRLRPTGPTAS